MADSVAYQHTDSNRDHDGSDVVYGVKKVGTDRKSVGPLLYYVTRCLIPCDFGYIMNHFILIEFLPCNKKRTQSSRLDAQPKNKFNH